MKNKLARLVLAGSFLLFSHCLHAEENTNTIPSNKSWQVTSLPLQAADNSESASLMLALHTMPAETAPGRIILFISLNKTANIDAALKFKTPLLRIASDLSKHGVLLAYADAPSDAKGRDVGHRLWEFKRDLQQSLRYLHTKFPGTPIDLAAVGDAAQPLLDVLNSLDGVSKVVILNGDFLSARLSDWHELKSQVLLIHSPGTTCPATPFYEAKLVADRNQFTLVQVGYPEPDTDLSCNVSEQYGFHNFDQQLVELLTKWQKGTPLPSVIGFSPPAIAWREEVIKYTAPAVVGTNKLEMTLLFPEGKGPFPVLIFNHGDVLPEDLAIKTRRRVRMESVTYEFLHNGIAVALPTRPGVGLSEGGYFHIGSLNDADPLYVPRVHTTSILPAIEYLRSRPDIDSHRMIIGGQSAGGYAAMYIASLNLDGVIGAIDFAGGRTDAPAGGLPQYLNPTMVSGFATLGKTTRIPTLWLFAENDSRYTANTIRMSYDAFIKAGGKGKLILVPPIPGDGHFLYMSPQLWRAEIPPFLNEIGITKAPAEKDFQSQPASN